MVLDYPVFRRHAPLLIVLLAYMRENGIVASKLYVDKPIAFSSANIVLQICDYGWLCHLDFMTKSC